MTTITTNEMAEMSRKLADEAYAVDRFIKAYQRWRLDIRKERFAALPRRQRYRMISLGHGVQ